MRHRPELDGLRGIAILLVLASHTSVLGFEGVGGAAGVTLFFALSGFLITSLLLAEFERSGHINLRAFYVRRGLRLLPALFAVLLAVVVFLGLGLWPHTPQLDRANYGITILAVLAYVGNWASVAGVQLGVLGHCWSLAVEEQFYIVWPAALLLGLRFGRSRLGVGVFALAVAVTPWRVVLGLNGGFPELFAGTDARADALLFGCAVALVPPRLSERVGWVGLAGLLAIAAWPGDIGVGAYILVLPAAAAASTLAVAACPAVLAWRPLAFVGKISYGLYLWQGLVVAFGLPWPVAIALSFAVAYASWVLLERRFLELKSKLSIAQPASRRLPAPAQA